MMLSNYDDWKLANAETDDSVVWYDGEPHCLFCGSLLLEDYECKNCSDEF